MTPREERLVAAVCEIQKRLHNKNHVGTATHDCMMWPCAVIREALNTPVEPLRESAPPAAPASEPPIICCEPFDALGKNFCRLPAGHEGAHHTRPQPVSGPSLRELLSRTKGSEHDETEIAQADGPSELAPHLEKLSDICRGLRKRTMLMDNDTAECALFEILLALRIVSAELDRAIAAAKPRPETEGE